MTTPRDISGSAERQSIGHFFDAVSALVEKHPTLIGTQTDKTARYSQASFNAAGKHFNSAAKHERAEDRAVAATHVYRLQPSNAKAGQGSDADAGEMMKKMQRLQQLCKLHRIGLTIGTPSPGVIQINLTETPRPKRALKPAPPKIKFGRGF